MAGFLQHHIDTLKDWLDLWKIKVNPSKCHAIYFSNKHILPKRLYFNDTPINWEKSCKYLGVILDRRLTWKEHIISVKNKMRGAAIGIKSILHNREVNIRNKVRLYNGIVVPIATYASPVWAFAARTNLDILERTHNAILRKIRNGPRYLRNAIIKRELNTCTLRESIVSLAEKFYDSIGNLNNEIIAELPDYDFRNNTYCKRPRAVLNLTYEPP